ncbi:MAG: alpha/beta hydrolase [Fulvivirga sp.]|uniref:alpha/beta fold hydrolase n=1 Tax=Fulvivirga sp. TaxID=1931237 RepID=UPI0032EBCDD1
MIKSKNLRKMGGKVMAIVLLSLPLLSSCDSDDDYVPSREKKISVGDYALQTKIEGKGSYTVVFISGLGESLSTWNKVQPETADFATTISYDRGGIGKSDNAPGIRSSEVIAIELDRLLINSMVEAPYILVAHSIGGLHARAYAHKFPDKVAGMVLVDVIHEAELLIGLGNLPEGLTPELVLEQIADEQNMERGMRDEFIFSYLSAEQVAEASFPDVPLHIITAGLADAEESPDSRELRLMLHKQLADKIPGAVHTIANNSRHHIQNDDPELIIDSIKKIIEKSI